MIDGMSEERTVRAEGELDVSAVDNFYVRRINWLVEAGRVDLIDEIADDCERRRATRQPVESEDAAGGKDAVVRRSASGGSTPPARPMPPLPACGRGAPYIANLAASGMDESATAARVPTPVETGTRLALARLRRFTWATGRAW
jgi:hypothetical protein